MKYTKYYRDVVPFSEIAKELGVCEQRVRYLYNNAILKLSRDPIALQTLVDMVEARYEFRRIPHGSTKENGI